MGGHGEAEWWGRVEGLLQGSSPLCRNPDKGRDAPRLFLRDSFVIWLFFTVEVVNHYLFPDDVGDLRAVMRHGLVLNLCFAFRMAFELIKEPIGEDITGGGRHER